MARDELWCSKLYAELPPSCLRLLAADLLILRYRKGVGRPFGVTGTVAYDVLRGKADDGEKRGSVVRLSLAPTTASARHSPSLTHQFAAVHRDGQETPNEMRVRARPIYYSDGQIGG